MVGNHKDKCNEKGMIHIQQQNHKVATTGLTQTLLGGWKMQTKDQVESFDDAKGLHESYASQRFTQDKAIRVNQDG